MQGVDLGGEPRKHWENGKGDGERKVSNEGVQRTGQ